MEEERVTLVGPREHKDVFDLQLGVRFVEGRATGVPLPAAQRAVSERRGYYIEYPVRYEPAKGKGDRDD